MTGNGPPDADGEFKRPNPTKPQKLRNVTCVYCLEPLGDSLEATVDHVVARRFVPSGAWENTWNLHVQACRGCNTKKSELEDHVSAASMQPDVFGKLPVDDSAFRIDACRKANGSVSPLTGKPIKDSAPRLTLNGDSPIGKVRIDLAAPPQMDSERAFDLAFLQVAAFFYYNSYDHDQRIGRRWIGSFAPIDAVHRGDWGNVQLAWFSTFVQHWDHRFHGVTAADCFKIMIRRAPSEANVWAWALEWNLAFRVVGFMGEDAQVEDCLKQLPPHKYSQLKAHDGSVLWFRVDVPDVAEQPALFVDPK